MTLVAVATTFVSEARSKTVSAVIGSTVGATARFPYAFRNTTFPCRPTRTTAPGHSFFAIDSVTTAVDAGEALGRQPHGRGRRDREGCREKNCVHFAAAPSAATIARSLLARAIDAAAHDAPRGARVSRCRRTGPS